MKNDDRAVNILKLTAFAPFGPKRITLIEKRFSNLEDVFTANKKLLLKTGISEKIMDDFIAWRKTFNIASVLQLLEKEKISFIDWHSPLYSKLLLEIYDPPPILFYQGNIDILNHGEHYLAVVGTRNNTAYGAKVISELIPQLKKHNFVIISGLAIGIDTLAHQAILNAAGLTVAVLGSGLCDHRIYPKNNRTLIKDIIKNNGLIISEFFPDVNAQKHNFPRRNRIISGLSEAVLVVEAQEKSGSLITSRCALEQNRDVLTIPGNIFAANSKGTNLLIKSGAKVITDTEDIIENFKIEINLTESVSKEVRKNLSQTNNPTEETIYQLIRQADMRCETITSNEIAKKTELDTSEINSTLSILEINGAIKNTDGYLTPIL